MEKKINLLECHGKRFRAKVTGAKILVEGRVSVNGEETYLCHSNIDADGNQAPDMLGYSYSWECSVGYMTLEDWGVWDLELLEEEPVEKEEVKERMFTREEMLEFSKYILEVADIDDSDVFTLGNTLDEWLRNKE